MGVRCGTMAITMSGFRFFTIEQVGDTVIARPVDPYLQGTALAELVKLELLQITESTGCKAAVIDFQNVKLISSSVISSLLGVKRQLASSGIPFTLCGMTDSLRHVFRTLNMDGTVFQIVDDIGEALSGDARVTSYYDVCGQASPPDEELQPKPREGEAPGEPHGPGRTKSAHPDPRVGAQSDSDSPTRATGTPLRWAAMRRTRRFHIVFIEFLEGASLDVRVWAPLAIEGAVAALRRDSLGKQGALVTGRDRAAIGSIG